MKAFIKVLQDIALLALRLVVGGVLLVHGWTRWQVRGVEHTADIISAAGLPEAVALAWLTIAFELIGGTLLVFGLGTPLIGLGLAVMQAVIVFTSKWDSGFFVADSGWEYNAVMAAVGLVLMTHGSGRAGVDALFVRPKHDEPDSSLIESHSRGDDDPVDRPAGGAHSARTAYS